MLIKILRHMRNVKSFIVIIAVYTLGHCTSCIDQSPHKKVYNGIDAELYKDTPAWQLVSALDNGKFELAKEQIRKDSSLANFVELVYGNSVLFWAALKSNEKAVELLLNNGARVNMCNYFGESPLEMAAFYNPCESNILHMMLKNQPLNDSMSLYLRNEALVLASKNCLNKVQLLIKNGATPYWISNTDTPLQTLTPLSAAIVQKRFDIVEYYLIDLGVDPSTGSITTIDGDVVSITELLQKSYNVERTFGQEKTREQIQRILEFLEKKEPKR